MGSPFSPDWVLKALLSGDYRRLEQTQRELAKRTLQSQGYANQVLNFSIVDTLC